jgi:uncharacterized membrane protein
MEGFGFIVLLVLAYPFIAAWMVGAGRNRRLEALEREVAALREELHATRPSPDRAGPAFAPFLHPEEAPPAEPAPPEAALADWVDEPVQATVAAGTFEAQEPEPVHPVAPAAVPDAQPTEAGAYPKPGFTPPRWLAAAKTWLLTGNPVAKIGLVILFIGVGFLLKYVAATVVVPIELRLAGVVLADLALLGWGWRLRTSRREIGLPVQGTAIAILMLVIFGAYQRYGLLPAGFAFALLVVLTVFTCLLAVLQDAVWLAVFGITGGFACPLLVSSGQGNHIALFSYYALLNAGVFALAIKRNWRPLNLLGFAFTFVVGALWGGLRYSPDNYVSAQGFLILFFVFYVAIALAYARRQQTRLKDYVDATLVLGTPLLAFGLQVGLVKDKPFGLALSALALGGFYMALAIGLWRHGRERWRLLVETFAALGVIFGTLAIPFALDARWTSGAWALEGAGFVWFGLRRGQRRTWMFGMLLQAGAWLSFGGSALGLDANSALASNLWLGFAVLAGGAFAMAAALRRHAGDEAPVVSTLASWSLAIAAVWLLAGWWTESIIRTSGSVLANWLVTGAVLTTALLAIIAVRMAWQMAGMLALAAQLAGAVGLMAVSAAGWTSMDLFDSASDKPLLGAVMIAVAAFATSRMTGRTALAPADKRLSPAFLVWGGIWWFGPVFVIAAGRLVSYLPDALGASHARWTLLYALGVAATVVACMQLARRLQWAQLRWLSAGCWLTLAVVTASALTDLYAARLLPESGVWLAWLILLASGEYVLQQWSGADKPLQRAVLQAVHVLRTAGPWLALWPAGSILIDGWLRVSHAGQDLAATAHWASSAAWGNYLPTWGMMLALALLLRRSGTDRWPARPLSAWYRAVLIPCGALLVLALAAVWNISQDGTMLPLPYLPLLNPLDLTTGFALTLWVGAMEVFATRPGAPARLQRRLRIASMSIGYIWFNLILLRSAAHYLGIAYRFDDLAASQFVQAMLSLVWSASALVIMRYAAQRAMRRTWGTGALLLCIVVGKLFAVDLANGGSMARVVSFVGVGLLMLLIGYFAPYPKASEGNTSPSSSV